MLTILQYLKNNIDTFDIVNFFKFFNYTTEKDCRKGFKMLVEAAASVNKKRYEKLIKFAAYHEENNYQILNNDECKQYYSDLKMQEVLDSYEEVAWNREKVAAVKSTDVSKKILQSAKSSPPLPPQQQTSVQPPTQSFQQQQQEEEEIESQENRCNKRQKISNDSSDVLFCDVSFDSVDSSSSFSLLESDLSIIEELEADMKIMFIWERSFEEFGNDNVTENTSLYEQSEWLKLYERACELANNHSMSPLHYTDRLAFSGIFNDDDPQFKNLRSDLPRTTEKNITLLKRALTDEHMYIPYIHNDTDELVLNHILTNIYIQHSIPSDNQQTQGELDLIAKTVSNVICSLFSERALFVKWDTVSSVFKNVKHVDKKYYRPDVTFYAKTTDGTTIEVGNAEIKPKKTVKRLVDFDRIKILEVAKRQLHLRLKIARSSEELFTFAMLVHGENIEQYVVYFKNGFYGYTLMAKYIFPNCKDSAAFIDNALELLLGFKDCIKRSIVSAFTDSESSAIYNAKKNNLIPTVAFCHKYKKLS